MVFTQYYLGFVLLGHGVALIVLRRWRAVGRIAIAGLVSLALCLPIVWILPIHLGNHTNQTLLDVSLFGAIRYVMSDVVDMVVPHKEEYGLRLGRVLRYGLIAFAALIAVRNHRRIRPEVKSAIVVVVVGTALFSLVTAYVTGTSIMTLRHYVGVFPYLPVALIGVLLPWIDVESRKTVSRWSAAVVMVALTAFATVGRFTPTTKIGSMDQVAEYLETHVDADDTILVYPPVTYETMTYHYSGSLPLTVLPAPIDYDTTHEYAAPERIRAELGAAIERIRSDIPELETRESIWLVTNERREFAPTDPDHPHVPDPLINTFGGPTTIVSLNGTVIRRFEINK
jgi:hypothetical protein